jgi:PAS domain S-box-containing protein
MSLKDTHSAQIPQRYFLQIIAVFFIILFFQNSTIANHSADLLTPEERAWLNKNKNSIHYAIPNYPPYDFIDENGEPAGLVSEQVALIEKMFGFRFQIVKTSSWIEIIEKAHDRKIEMFSSATPTEERKAFLEFSPEVFKAEAAIIVRTDAHRYKSVDDMCGKTIGAGKGYIATTLFANQFPCIKLQEFNDDDEGLQAVAFGEIDGFLSDLGTATWLIRKRQLNNLRLGSEILYRIPNCIGIRKDVPLLVSIIRKGITAIPDSEREVIQNRWIGNLERQPLTISAYLKFAFPVIVPILLLLVLSLLWSWTLRKTVALRTEELTQRSRQLADNEQFYREVFNATSDGLFIHDVNGRILDVNDCTARMYGYSHDSFLSFEVNDLSSTEPLYSAEQVAHLFKQVLEKGPQVFEWKYKRSNGDLFWTEVALRPCSILGEQRVIASVRDINERKLTEKTLRENNERLRHSEKMEAIGQLAGGIAHDFNNMLTGIIASADILQNQTTDNPTARKFLAMIISSSQRASELARNLLTFARRQVVVSAPIDAHQCILDAVSILQNTIDKRIVITTDLAAENSIVHGDKSQIQSAFLNLGINASHAMADGGRLEFRSHSVHLSGDDCRMGTFKLIDGDYVVFDIIDTGCGIPQEILPRIFEPFFTTKEQGKGSGLGLAATYGMVQQHSGAIAVESIVGKGTHFTILLPLIASSEPENGLSKPVDGNGLILIADDEEIIRTTSVTALEKLGYSVLTASNGIEAIDIYSKNKDSVSLVLLDMMMPEMNGRDCFFILKEIQSDIPVILMSGLSEENDIREMNDTGLAGFVHKPFKWSDLSKLINDVLHKKDVH